MSDIPIADGGTGASHDAHVNFNPGRGRSGLSHRDYKITRYGLLIAIFVGDLCAMNLPAPFAVRLVVFVALGFLYVSAVMLTSIAERLGA